MHILRYFQVQTPLILVWMILTGYLTTKTNSDAKICQVLTREKCVWGFNIWGPWHLGESSVYLWLFLNLLALRSIDLLNSLYNSAVYAKIYLLVMMFLSGELVVKGRTLVFRASWSRKWAKGVLPLLKSIVQQSTMKKTLSMLDWAWERHGKNFVAMIQCTH